MTAHDPVVLHVEDDANDVVLWDTACRRAAVSFTVRVVNDAPMAMAYLLGQNCCTNPDSFVCPNLVLLDLNLPGMRGLELLQWIRQQQQFRALPVVVLSSSNYPEDIRCAYESGANSYLVKPINFESLVEVAHLVDRYWLKLNLPFPGRNNSPAEPHLPAGSAVAKPACHSEP